MGTLIGVDSYGALRHVPPSSIVDFQSTILINISANLECRSEMCCTRLAGNTGRKSEATIAISALSHNFVRLYHRN